MFWRRQALLTVRPTRLGIMRVFQPNDAAADTAQNGYRARRPARTGRAPTSRTALRSAGAGQHVLVSAGRPRVAGTGNRPARTAARGAVMSALAPALQAFFTERLIVQRNASPHTIAAYRDTFRLLLRFAHQQTGKAPFQLDIDD